MAKIYHRGILSKTFINSLPKGHKIEEYKLPKLIWSFLESFYPGNCKNCILLLNEVVKTEPIEFVFTLLAKQLRDLYWVKKDYKSMPYPSWRLEKLQRQAQRYDDEKLKVLINELALIDVRSKTWDCNLLDLLGFTIATKLE